jgi:hypothetical protein
MIGDFKLPESAMNAKAGLQVMTLAVALVGASAAVPGGMALAQDVANEQPAAATQPRTLASAAKADLDGSEIRVVVTHNQAARGVTRISVRQVVLPRILGTYR